LANPGSGSGDAAVEPALLEWIKKAKKGDLVSYQRLYDHFAKRVLNFIYRMVNSVEEAEDLTQDTFVTVYRKLNSLKDDARFEPWLYRIARNNVYQRYRNRPPAMIAIDSETDDGRKATEIADGRKSPDDEVQTAELKHVIHTVILELPEKYREVFVLSALRRLRYDEIAEIVGRSLASVKTDIHRARLQVRERVKSYLKV